MRLRRPAPGELARLLAAAKEAAPTYADVGATEREPLPAGFRHDRDSVVLGVGQETYARAVALLRVWGVQRGAGLAVTPVDAVVEPGATVVLIIRAAGLWTTAPCRVVHVSEEPSRFAFAYGTLPGHPETGEAAFAIERGPAGEVVFRVWSFSRPVDPLARLAAPLARRIQRRVTQRYLDVLAGAA
jgi:uncharacterized protein (UPF0548 family)